MAKNDKKTPAGDALPPEILSGASNLEKIRDLLFGAQVQRHDAELAGVEKRLRKALEAMQADLKAEVQRLGERIDKEHKERGASVDKLAGSLKDNVAKIGEQLSDAERTLQEELHAQGKALGEEMRANHSEATAALDRAVAELRHEKTDRAALANLFRGLAGELADDGKKKR